MPSKQDHHNRISNEHADYVVMGVVGKCHGYKGWFSVIPASEDPDAMLDYLPWLLVPENSNMNEAISVKTAKFLGKKLIAKVDGIDDDHAAKKITHHRIMIKKSQLKVLGEHEYYWHELIGMQVINQDQQSLGQVEQIIDSSAQNLLQVNDKRVDQIKPPLLIPCHPNILIKVDKPKDIIHVNWSTDWLNDPAID
jgi:16S rRNA processing protein RimM